MTADNPILAAIDRATPPEEPQPPAFSDESLALRFTDRHRDDLRYVAAWSRWFIWDSARWRAEDTHRAFDLARAICRAASAECNKPNVAAAVASAKTVAAIERLAKADRAHAATVDQWDTDIFLLNTPTSAISINTGTTRPHRRDDYCTKITSIAPAPPGTDCPLWRDFLQTVMANDQDTIDFLQRVAGYCLTGSTKEHALFFAYGTGANGKSVFINTISKILGDYATSTPMETLTASYSDRHPTEIADLRGARLVTAIETEDGRRWAESRIKAMTGGDPLKARLMRQDFFEFTPQFKLVIAGNHKPGLRGVDEAIRRRFHLIPFAITIPTEARDLDLTEKLKAEWPAILRWMIDGAALWQQIGLAPPKSVRDATREYMEDEDGFAIWVDECCQAGKSFYTTGANLFKSWKAFAERTGEPVGSQKRFTQTLIARGYCPRRDTRGRRGFDGIMVNPEDTADQY